MALGYNGQPLIIFLPKQLTISLSQFVWFRYIDDKNKPVFWLNFSTLSICVSRWLRANWKYFIFFLIVALFLQNKIHDIFHGCFEIKNHRSSLEKSQFSNSISFFKSFYLTLTPYVLVGTIISLNERITQLPCSKCIKIVTHHLGLKYFIVKRKKRRR